MGEGLSGGNASQNLAAESISAPLSRFRRSSALAGRPPHGPSESPSCCTLDRGLQDLARGLQMVFSFTLAGSGPLGVDVDRR